MTIKNRAQLMLAQIQSLVEEARDVYGEIIDNEIASSDAEELYSALDSAEYCAKCLVKDLG